MKVIRALVVIGAVLLSGCGILPWPHKANTTPAVQGTLYDGDRPLVGSEVRIATGTEQDPCGGTTVDSRTEPDGAFSVPALTNVQLFSVPMAHSVFTWHLCYKEQSAWKWLSSAKRYTLVDTGPYGMETMHCNVARAGEDKCQVHRENE